MIDVIVYALNERNLSHFSLYLSLLSFVDIEKLFGFPNKKNVIFQREIRWAHSFSITWKLVSLRQLLSINFENIEISIELWNTLRVFELEKQIIAHFLLCLNWIVDNFNLFKPRIYVSKSNAISPIHECKWFVSRGIKEQLQSIHNIVWSKFCQMARQSQ